MPTADERDLVGQGPEAYNAAQGASIGAAPDQSYKPYIGVKLIHAYPCQNDGVDGYNVKYADGYESWSPKAAFEHAYLGISIESSITPKEIERFMGEITTHKIDEKTCLVSATHITGFVQHSPSSCVDPKNYSEEMGRKVGIKKIEDGLWFALGFVLQWAKYGLKKVEKRPIQ